MYDVTRKNPADRPRSSADAAAERSAARAAARAEAKAGAAAQRSATKAEAKATAAAAKVEATRAKAVKHTDRARGTVGRAVAKVDGVLAAEAAKQQRLAERAEEQAAKLDRLAGYLGVIDVWTRVEPGGRKPRFTREEIAVTAVRIADEEGIDALSMRHLASEIGAGTMTLYHYVRTKDELMTLVHDAVMGEVVLPAGETLPTDWRAALTVIANRSRTVMMRHPWMFDITDHPPLGPNSVRHFDQTLEAVCSLDVALLDKLDIISCVDEYVFGYCLQQRNHSSGDPGLPDAMRDYVDSLIATGGYPQLEAMADTSSLEQTWAAIAAHLAEPERFDRNLARLLDGIEAGLPPAAGRS